jgi:hypothetical protein
MHDGASPHVLLAAWEFLNNVFPEQWIRRGELTAWPVRSPDLSLLDFYFLGHLNSTVYAAAISDVHNLQQRIQNAFETIRTTPGIFQRLKQSLFRRATSWVEARGGHFEHFI